MYLKALSMACQALQDWSARVGGVTRGEVLQGKPSLSNPLRMVPVFVG